MLDRVFWWLNDRDMVRLAIALIGGPGSSLFMTKPFGWISVSIGMTLLTATTVFALLWCRWVERQNRVFSQGNELH